MRVAERTTPVAAVIAALSTLTCCLPFGFLGAVGFAGLSIWAQIFRFCTRICKTTHSTRLSEKQRIRS